MVITSFTPAHKISRILVLPGQNSTRITALIWSILNARQQLADLKSTLKRILQIFLIRSGMNTSVQFLILRIGKKC